MAFQTNRSTFSKPATSAPASSQKTNSVQLGGAYEGKPDSKLVLKTGKLKEPITIPAGYVIKVFKKGGVSKNGKDLPPFEIVAQESISRS